jgi:hypothetical protein
MTTIIDRAAKVRELIQTSRDVDEELFAFRLLSGMDQQEAKAALSQEKKYKIEAGFEAFKTGVSSVVGVSIVIGLIAGGLSLAGGIIYNADKMDKARAEERQACQTQLTKQKNDQKAATDKLVQDNDDLTKSVAECTSGREKLKEGLDMIVEECKKP